MSRPGPRGWDRGAWPRSAADPAGWPRRPGRCAAATGPATPPRSTTSSASSSRGGRAGPAPPSWPNPTGRRPSAMRAGAGTTTAGWPCSPSRPGARRWQCAARSAAVRASSCTGSPSTSRSPVTAPGCSSSWPPGSTSSRPPTRSGWTRAAPPATPSTMTCCLIAPRWPPPPPPCGRTAPRCWPRCRSSARWPGACDPARCGRR